MEMSPWRCECFDLGHNFKMKRKEKSGHQKRVENKKRALKECASAVAQKTLLSMFGKKDYHTVVENAVEVEEGLHESSPSPEMGSSDNKNAVTESSNNRMTLKLTGTKERN